MRMNLIEMLKIMLQYVEYTDNVIIIDFLSVVVCIRKLVSKLFSNEKIKRFYNGYIRF